MYKSINQILMDVEKFRKNPSIYPSEGLFMKLHFSPDETLPHHTPSVHSNSHFDLKVNNRIHNGNINIFTGTIVAIADNLGVNALGRNGEGRDCYNILTNLNIAIKRAMQNHSGGRTQHFLRYLI